MCLPGAEIDPYTEPKCQSNCGTNCNRLCQEVCGDCTDTSNKVPGFNPATECDPITGEYSSSLCE